MINLFAIMCGGEDPEFYRRDSDAGVGGTRSYFTGSDATRVADVAHRYADHMGRTARGISRYVNSVSVPEAQKKAEIEHTLVYEEKRFAQTHSLILGASLTQLFINIFNKHVAQVPRDKFVRSSGDIPADMPKTLKLTPINTPASIYAFSLLDGFMREHTDLFNPAVLQQCCKQPWVIQIIWDELWMKNRGQFVSPQW